MTIVYLFEHECDLTTPFTQAMKCDNSDKWFNVMKKELKSMDNNKAWDLVELH